MNNNKGKLAALIIMYKRKDMVKVGKKCWVKPWIQRRATYGACSTLTAELHLEDAQQFRNFVRMSAVQIIINLVGPKIVKQDTVMRSAIPVYEHVMVTLRFLSSGDSCSSLQYLFRIPVCTIGRIVKEVTLAIYNVLKESYLKFPNTKNEWLSIASSFNSRWNFPHCVGAIDGKHVSIQNPHNSGSHYFNYKGTYSIVLLAVADASYNLIYFDVGCNGRISDGRVFQNSSLHQGLEDGSIELPESTPLPDRNKPVPYCFVGDDAFAMKPYMLKPYPHQNQPAPNRIFNYRLSRARRIIENVFGIMANKFRVLRKPIALAPETVSTIVQAICALHNYLLSDHTLQGNYIHQGLVDTENTETHTLIPGSWRDDIPNSYVSLQKGKLNNYTLTQKLVRDEFREYFMTPSGEVNWQYQQT